MEIKRRYYHMLGKNNPSANMTRKHKTSLKKAWEMRKIKFGPTGARNPDRLKKLGRRAGLKTPHLKNELKQY